ncbi:ATP-dependent DNA helicase RecG [cyanobacterium endosymbiont of Rhopalodia gibberula]|uniref:ATP-dependent DNA helicase RecG n=1 Tax=cyanobacterium endosymbiont of Rhopalodia gibberula TaxID=1763363 RepID=UPI000DC6DAD6|nr:ATP-dependent DNA helicase RecG [cyanobacterium endosymbiont of Rhopalodia gibberula]BBA80208.1 ATP-dependent DNA helicase RecG [cyanobacterium endosymbiont of Rhopalodia gibberula]
MSTELSDWIRLDKSLSIEAKSGYTDIQGNKYRFSEFLCLNFGKTPPLGTLASDRSRWQSFAVKYAQYSQLSLSQRQSLISKTRQFLHELKLSLETASEPPSSKLPRTVSVVQKQAYPCKITLEQSLSTLVEVGYKKGELLKRLGLFTVKDILFYYPRDHINYARQVNISHLNPGETVTIVGSVIKCTCFTSPKNKKLSIFELIVRDNTGTIKLNRFFAGTRFTNRSWQEKQKRLYPLGSIIAASGLVKKNEYNVTLDNPEIEVLDGFGANIESLNIGRILPIYPLKEGISTDLIRRVIVSCLGATKQIRDPLPIALRDQYGLIKLKEAITNIHFPQTTDLLTHARRRLVFDEFFYLQVKFLQRRQEQKQIKNSVFFIPKGKLIEDFNKLLPFTLTRAQKRVINEILDDLNSSTAMNRLVQGDVGSGKTIIAIFSILAAIQSGYQAALMAPTEVLAKQHYHKLVSWFNLLYLPVELLTGSTRIAKRREIYSQLRTGELPLLVGTHALIQDKVNFQRLGLVVIDEQHRFGVHQRAKLLAKGKSPHVLTMTATPIPRTLSLTLHGDLDISQIDELPPERQPVQTTVLIGKERTKAYNLIRQEVAQGRQAYIILPMIEESENLDIRAAVEEHKKLSETVFPKLNIGLLHGRMSSVEKDEVLNNFRDNKNPIIISTTVIEVGVDVPNATVMLIENAERFGLSQLHQLRGRVGRGSHKSYCLLMSNSKTPDARQRLSVLEQSQDGFFISEMDLRFRGPGSVLGTRQSGLPDFALASLVEDQEILVLARTAAEKIIMADSHLRGMPFLKKELEQRYKKLIGVNILT